MHGPDAIVYVSDFSGEWDQFFRSKIDGIETNDQVVCVDILDIESVGTGVEADKRNGKAGPHLGRRDDEPNRSFAENWPCARCEQPPIAHSHPRSLKTPWAIWRITR